MNTFFQDIKEFLSRLPLGRQVALTTVVLGGIGLLIGIAYWAGQPDYALLFGRLDPTDASKIVESLESANVRYDIREGGSAIYVSRDQVYEQRLRLAGEGLVSEGPAGYELFDQGTLGMTDFMQRLNLKRALEGELARTIASIRQVEVARVHLVIPERSAFREVQAKASASVVLQLSGGSLSEEQIGGITQLVSGAVEGLSPAEVTVLDTRGNLLSNPDSGNMATAAGSTNLKMQSAVESHLTESGQSMLDRVLGPGNAIVRVSAALNFSTSIAETETIDPESATVISEETLEEQDGGAGSATSAVRNYEISRTRERTEQGVGDISYLTVSVILNYKQPPSVENAAQNAPSPEPVPYDQAEIANIESIVRNAVGFNEERGDRIAIHQTMFDTRVDTQISQDIVEQQKNERMQLYFRYGMMLLALGVAVWLIRSASRHLSTTVRNTPGLPAPAGQATLDQSARPRAVESRKASEPAALAAGAAPVQLQEEEEDIDVSVDDVYMSKLSPEAKRRLKAKHLMYEETKQQVLTKPEDAIELIRSWMAEDLKYEKKPA
jgi:flagellar M-ring protein FliF